MREETIKVHDIQDVYSRLGKVEQDIASIGPVLKQVSLDLTDLKAAKNQPTNWIGIGALVISFLLYMQTTQDPIKEKADLALDTLRDRSEVVHSSGSRLSNLENRSVLLESRLLKVEEVATAVNERTKTLDKQVQHIDSEGSRVWNKGKAE
jgi:hypothetical protein